MDKSVLKQNMDTAFVTECENNPQVIEVCHSNEIQPDFNILSDSLLDLFPEDDCNTNDHIYCKILGDCVVEDDISRQ